MKKVQPQPNTILLKVIKAINISNDTDSIISPFVVEVLPDSNEAKGRLTFGVTSHNPEWNCLLDFDITDAERHFLFKIKQGNTLIGKAALQLKQVSHKTVEYWLKVSDTNSFHKTGELCVRAKYSEKRRKQSYEAQPVEEPASPPAAPRIPMQQFPPHTESPSNFSSMPPEVLMPVSTPSEKARPSPPPPIAASESSTSLSSDSKNSDLNEQDRTSVHAMPAASMSAAPMPAAPMPAAPITNHLPMKGPGGSRGSLKSEEATARPLIFIPPELDSSVPTKSVQGETEQSSARNRRAKPTTVAELHPYDKPLLLESKWAQPQVQKEVLKEKDVHLKSEFSVRPHAQDKVLDTHFYVPRRIAIGSSEMTNSTRETKLGELSIPSPSPPKSREDTTHENAKKWRQMCIVPLAIGEQASREAIMQRKEFIMEVHNRNMESTDWVLTWAADQIRQRNMKAEELLTHSQTRRGIYSVFPRNLDGVKPSNYNSALRSELRSLDLQMSSIISRGRETYSPPGVARGW